MQVVDDNDKPIGGATRKELKTQGLKYRIVRISVEDGNGGILIQKRVPTKDTYPDCWDNSAAGHVDEGEDYIDAAKRELNEEIGLQDVNLEEVTYYYSETVSPNGLYLNRFTKIYRVIVPNNTQFTVQPEEVSEVMWTTLDHIKKLAAANDQISDGLLQTYERYYSTFDENH